MAAVIEADSKGRILLPLDVRRRLGARRFELIVEGEQLVLRPLRDFRELKAKYQGWIKASIQELEEGGEKLVRQGRR